MDSKDKPLIKCEASLSKFIPQKRKELVLRGLLALEKTRDADYYFYLGEEYRKKGKLKKAIEYYDKALEIDPAHEMALFCEGCCYFPHTKKTMLYDLGIDKKSRDIRAIKVFQKLVNIRKRFSKKDWGLFFFLGISYYFVGQHEKAIENFNIGLRLNPHHAQLFQYLGFAQNCLGLYKEAIESYEQSLKLNPKEVDLYYGIALCQRRMGLHQLSTQSFKNYISMEGDKTPRWVEIAKRCVNGNK
jgi:tetratricopeptide (TPR) repeat protein